MDFDKKQTVGACLSGANIEYLDSEGRKHSRTRSWLLEKYVTAHRLLHRAGIITEPHAIEQDLEHLVSQRVLAFELLLDRASKQLEAAVPVKCGPAKRTRGIA